MDSSFNIGVHAVVFLCHKDRYLSSEELADNICTSAPRVRKIISSLKKAGILETREGVDGGCRLAVPPETLTLRQIAEALDSHFVATSWKSGDPEKACLISSGMGDFISGLYEALNAECFRYLDSITIRELEQRFVSRRKT